MNVWIDRVRDILDALWLWLVQFIADAWRIVSPWFVWLVARVRALAVGDIFAMLSRSFNWFLKRAQTNTGIHDVNDKFAFSLRWFSWSIFGIMCAYILNCYLSYWQNWPSALALLQNGEFGVLTSLQTAFYPLSIGAAAVFTLRTATERTLRDDSQTLNDIVTFIVRAAFWAVLLIGLVDALISFLRVEGLLEYVLGSELAQALGRSHFRGSYVHMPLCVIAIYIATRRTTIDFIWLSLLVVGAELAIVITRFVFSYEQIFMGDLVRFWYAALFLFASAYTLYTDTHVRVDVFYASFSKQKRSAVNGVGAVVLGIVLCWTILLMGMWSKTSILITPLLGFEISQSGFGMYVKYLMASFLLIFAITMMIQFISSLLESAADYRGDPGGREPDPTLRDEARNAAKQITQ
ncbi:MAG: TRAP transporter small permease subunit [Pseudomonadota bacterium]